MPSTSQKVMPIAPPTKKMITLHNFKKPAAVTVALAPVTTVAPVDPLLTTTGSAALPPPPPPNGRRSSAAPVKVLSKRPVPKPSTHVVSNAPTRLIAKKKMIAPPKKADSNRNLVACLDALVATSDAVVGMIRGCRQKSSAAATNDICASPTTCLHPPAQAAGTTRIDICEWWEAPVATFATYSSEEPLLSTHDGPTASYQHRCVRNFAVNRAFPGCQSSISALTVNAISEKEAFASLLRSGVPPLMMPAAILAEDE
jgi:hypothetical protein